MSAEENASTANIRQAIWRAVKMKTNYERKSSTAGGPGYDGSSYGPWSDGLWLAENWDSVGGKQDSIYRVLTDPVVFTDEYPEDEKTTVILEKDILGTAKNIDLTHRSVVSASILIPKIKEFEARFSSNLPEKELDIMIGVDRIKVADGRPEQETGDIYYWSNYFPSVTYYERNITPGSPPRISVNMTASDNAGHSHIIKRLYIDNTMYQVDMIRQ